MIKKKKSLRGLDAINQNAAGIDIGAYEHYVAVPPDRCDNNVRSFGTCTEDLKEMLAWLKKNKVDTVAMESTGTYWIPLFDLLEENGLEVILVNPRHAKNVSGRKTDVSDCQWIQQLHTYGLLEPAFRPDLVIRVLRTYFRQRRMLKQQATKCIQRLHKDFHAINVKLDSVVNSLTSVTAMKIIRAIVEDNITDPNLLAEFRDHRCRKSKIEIARALEGNYTEESLFVLRQHLKMYDMFQNEIVECDKKINLQLQTMVEQSPETNSKVEKQEQKKKSKDLVKENLITLLGVDITAINGVSTEIALTIVSEIGFDFSKFPTAKHFTSWLGLAANNKISGGKIIGRGFKPTPNIAKVALRMAASTLARTKTPLGSFFRRIQSRHGFGKAATATARKIAVYIYNMVVKQEEFKAVNQDEYERQINEQMLKQLERKAIMLGKRLVSI